MDKLEKEIEGELKEKLERRGCYFLKFVSPGNRGVPDRIVILPDGIVIFMELKKENGRLAPLQKVWRERLMKRRCFYELITSKADADDFIRRIDELFEKGEEEM